MISVTYADALIACFDAKYHYAFWRPITAIRAGDTDGNDRRSATRPGLRCFRRRRTTRSIRARTRASRRPGDVSSRDSCGTGEIDFTVPSLTGLGDRHFDTVWDLQYEVGNARIWGGIHFRSAVQDGITIGVQTVQQVLSHHFQRSWH